MGNATGLDFSVDRGIADDEFAADDDGVGGSGRGGAAELVEKAAGGLFAYFFAGVVDGGELGLDDPGDGVIVKTDYCDIFGYAEAAFLEGLAEYGGKEIIGDEDSVGAYFHSEDLAGSADGGGFAEVVDDEQIGVKLETVVGERLFVSFQTACIDVTMQVSGDVRDAAAALCGEVRGGFVAGLYVVDDHAGSVGEFFYAIEEDDRYAFLDEGIEVIHFDGVEGERGDESVDAFVEKVMDVCDFFAIGFGGMADDEVITCVGGDLFDAGEYGADELAF